MSPTRQPSRSVARAAAVAALLAGTAAAVFAAPGRASADDGRAARDRVGHVYQATNAADANAVQVFDRAADGRLTPGALVPTGGRGLGASLASQGGIVRDGDRLLVVNAGDDTVTSFVIGRRGLERRDMAPSGGDRPVSVTVHDELVYVLNAGSDSISALRLDDDGDLRPVADSTRPLSGTATGAAQVQFSRDAVAGSTGAGPTDVAQSRDGRFLYVRVRSGDVAMFAVNGDGSLTSLGSASGATAIGPSGLAAS